MPKKRTHTGKKCCCSTHETHDDNHPVTTFYELNRRDKKLRTDEVDYLTSEGFVEESVVRYGKICIDCVTSLLRSEDPRTSKRPRSVIPPKAESDIDIDSICNHISELVRRDITAIYEKGRPTLDNLLSYSPRLWLEGRPQELIRLVAGICGIDVNDDKKLYILAKTVEQIYFIRNSRLVLPLSFRESILLYTWTKSRKVVTMHCTNTPSSSYTTINRFLESEAADEIEMPSGSVRCAFDNNQIIGKTHIISGKSNKVPTSVMTSTAYVQMKSSSDVQKLEELKPSHWMWRKETEAEREQLLGLSPDVSRVDFFRKTRNAHVQHYLSIVYKQQEDNKDYIDSHISNEELARSMKLCDVCGSENDKDYRICRNPGCRGPLSSPPLPDIRKSASEAEPATSDATMTFRKMVTVLPNEAKVMPGEPDFVNPNSYSTIIKVLQNLGRRGGVAMYGGTDREWLFVECDGLPYKIMRGIMDHTYICKKCNTSYYTAETFNSEDHRCYMLYGEQPLTREFEWLVPIMGLLHLEMNSARAFIKLNWDVFVSSIAHTVGFESPKAQEYCKKGSDHHKTWQLLQIIYITLTEEMLVPYVRYAMQAESLPTVQGYWDWCETNKDPNYMYIQSMVLTYLHSLMLFRVGVRHNDVGTISTARLKFEPLMYATSHPKYQEILYRDNHDQLRIYEP